MHVFFVDAAFVAAIVMDLLMVSGAGGGPLPLGPPHLGVPCRRPLPLRRKRRGAAVFQLGLHDGRDQPGSVRLLLLLMLGAIRVLLPSATELL